MKNVNRWILVVAGLATFAVLGCMAPAGGRSAPSNSVAAMVLTSGSQCQQAPATWRATWINSQNDLHQFTARCHANRIGGVAADLKAIDFSRFGLMAVEMGQQPTAGYGVQLETQTVSIRNRTAEVVLVCQRPASGTITAQVLTSPWMVIQLERGAYQRIDVKDQNGRMLTRLSVQE